MNKILFRYPQISAEWLICGSGEMMKKNTISTESDHSGSIFAGDDLSQLSRKSKLNREEMKTILFQMAGILSGHQQEISRLINELELNGKRSDRLLDIIEHGFVREDEPAVIKRDASGYRPDAIGVD